MQAVTAFAFGVVFVVVMLFFALYLPNPTPFQYEVCRTVLALAAAGVAAMIPGLMSLAIIRRKQLVYRATSAMLVFLIVYFFSPAKAVSASPPRPDGAFLLRETERVSTYAVPQVMGPALDGRPPRRSETSPAYEPASAAQAVVTTGLGTASKIAELRGHTGRVRCLAFSADGKSIATGAEDGSVILWNLGQSKPLWTLRAYGGTVRTVAFSPDGRLLAYAGDGAEVILWDLLARKLAHVFSVEGRWGPSKINSVAFSHDGRFLGATGTGPIVLWDISKKREIVNCRWQETIPSYGYAFAFSPVGQSFAIGCNGGERSAVSETVRLWKSPNQSVPQLLVGNSEGIGLSHEDVTGALLFSPDGAVLVRATKSGSSFGGRSSAGSIKSWNLQHQMAQDSATIPFGNVYAAGFYGGTNLLVISALGQPDPIAPAWAFSRTGSGGSFLGLWDSRDRRSTAFETDHKDGIAACAIGPRCEVIATSGITDYTVSLWNRHGLASEALRRTEMLRKRFLEVFERLAADSPGLGGFGTPHQDVSWRRWLDHILSVRPDVRSIEDLTELQQSDPSFRGPFLLQTSLGDEDPNDTP